MFRKIIGFVTAAALMFGITACSAPGDGNGKEETPSVQKNGSVVVLFTSDIHCGIEDGFGMEGLQQIRDTLEEQGYTTILVDDGDAVQGEAIGVLTKGEAVLQLMNELHYDAAIPGNHEFDFGMDQFIKLTEMAEFPYLSCNISREGEFLLPSHTVIEAAGLKIGFVGVTTPRTILTSTPSFFQNDQGEYIYDFMQKDDGTMIYEAVQKAADEARAEGADFVYVMGHLGNEAECEPWTYADVIANTRGIDVLLDGHSHDTDQVVMKNADGDKVIRAACGTKLGCIGYSFISPEDGVGETGIWTWNNGKRPSEILGFRNIICEKVEQTMSEFEEIRARVVASSSVELTINDPVEKDAYGLPIRMVRRAETNLGDLVCDSMRATTDADISLMNGGGIRISLPKGYITYGDVLGLFPYGNTLCSVKATGQQILDALEWGARSVPDENGTFLHVSGLSCTIDVSVKSSCLENESGEFAGVGGERRVKNVMVGGEPIDPEKTYIVGSTNYLLLQGGGGNTAFRGAEIVLEEGKLDNQALIDYIKDELGGTVGSEYAEPTGQGRITIIGG